MPIATAVGVIIAAIIAGGTAVTSSVIASADQDEAREEAKGLAGIRRSDILGQQREATELSREGQAIQRLGIFAGQQQFQQKLKAELGEAEKARKERTEERLYKRKQDIFSNALTTLNTNVGLRNRMLQRWGGGQ